VEEQMSTPTGENASLRDLERTVRAELTLAESSVSEQEVLDTPLENWLFDPEDAQRDAVALRSLLAGRDRRRRLPTRWAGRKRSVTSPRQPRGRP